MTPTSPQLGTLVTDPFICAGTVLLTNTDAVKLLIAMFGSAASARVWARTRLSRNLPIDITTYMTRGKIAGGRGARPRNCQIVKDALTNFLKVVYLDEVGSWYSVIRTYSSNNPD